MAGVPCFCGECKDSEGATEFRTDRDDGRYPCASCRRTVGGVVWYRPITEGRPSSRRTTTFRLPD